MHASQLWYPEIVHSGSNKSFSSFYAPKVSEMTRNTPKHHYGSNGVEWIGLFVWLVADGWCWFVLREKYCSLVADGWFVLREKYCWLVADKPYEQGGCFTTLVPEIVHSGSKISYATCTCQILAKCSETHTNIIFVPIE
jgi:hypothetical protein